nr:porin [Paracoccus stylophorae]
MYFGNTGGAAGRVAPPRAGGAGISVGHGAYQGVVGYWGNLPYGGGTGRPDRWDWADGIPGGRFGAGYRTTAGAVKLGYTSPDMNGFTVGASVNLNPTYRREKASDTPSAGNDRFDDLSFRNEWEAGIRWSGDLPSGDNLALGLTHGRACITTATCHDGNMASAMLTRDLGGNRLRGSLALFNMEYDRVGPEVRTGDDEWGFHLGADYQVGKWTYALNYIRAFNPKNGPALMDSAAPHNWAVSLGADCKIAETMDLGVGVVRASNGRGEKVNEVGMSLTYRFNARVNRDNSFADATSGMFR